MTLSPAILKDVEEALDELRNATVNRDITRADQIRDILMDYLEPEGYTLVEDPKLVYVVMAKG